MYCCLYDSVSCRGPVRSQDSHGAVVVLLFGAALSSITYLVKYTKLWLVSTSIPAEGVTPFNFKCNSTHILMCIHYTYQRLLYTSLAQQEIAVVGTGGMRASSFIKPAPPGQHPIGQGQPLPNNGRTDTAKLDRTAAKVSATTVTSQTTSHCKEVILCCYRLPMHAVLLGYISVPRCAFTLQQRHYYCYSC
jgi:hypothetical protein